MIRQCLCFLFLVSQSIHGKTLTDFKGRIFQIPDSTPRVVSGFVGADEILVALYKNEPDRLLALSPLATDPKYSAIPIKAQKWKNKFGNELESLIAMKPDLVIVASYTRPEWLRILLKAKIKTFVLGYFRNIKDIQDNISTIGKLTNKQEQASKLLAHMNQKILSLKRTCPTNQASVINYSMNNTLFGRNTSFDALLATLHLKNVAANMGIKGWAQVSIENLVLVQPDYIVTSGFESKHQAILQLKHQNGWKHLKAVKEERIILIRTAFLSSISHHITSAMEELCNQL